MEVRVWRYLLALILLGSSVVMPVQCRADGNMIELSIDDKVIQAELAQTRQERTKGLMHRESLCENCGMLFVFPTADKWSFWSKNTPLALSVAFVDGSGRIVQIVDMEPNSIETHQAAYQAVYALEMARGWFARNSIKAGSNIEGLLRINRKMDRPLTVSSRKDAT